MRQRRSRIVQTLNVPKGTPRILTRCGLLDEIFEPLAGRSGYCCATRASPRGSRVQNILLPRLIYLNASSPVGANPF